MFFLDEDESRYVLRGLAPRARSEGVAEEVRGWRWHAAPLLPLYEAPLELTEITDQRCASGRELYLRHVLGVAGTPSAEDRLEAAVGGAVADLIVAAKRTIYEHGPLAASYLSGLVAPASLPQPGDPAAGAGEQAAATLLWTFERRRIAASIEATLARQPRLSADGLVAAALPVFVGRQADGRLLGLAPHVTSTL